MNIPIASILALRTLHSVRKLHLPTYVATRFFLDSVAQSPDSTFPYVFLKEKYSYREKTRAMPFQRFKGLDENGSAIYRQFHAFSPSTILSEAAVLGQLASSPAFSKPDYVYSYRWPRDPDTSPYSFEHYVSGYQKRNENIYSSLCANSEYVAIIADLKNFYPTINQENVRCRLVGRLETDEKLHSEYQEPILKLLEQLFSLCPNGKGVPVGPETSHLAGDMAIEPIDCILSKKYPGRYFRYVDDIIVVADKQESKTFLGELSAQLNEEGLTLNEDKTDIVSGELWIASGPHLQRGVKTDSFESLIFSIKVYLLARPSRAKKLYRRLLDEGFAIPVYRFAVPDRESAFTNRLKYFLKQRWRVAWDAYRASETDIVVLAHSVRKQLIRRLEDHLSKSIPESPTQRRWYIQKLRYFVNRALYVVPHGELRPISNSLQSFPEFAEMVALLALLLDGDQSKILKMPGPTLISAAEFYKQKQKVFEPIQLASMDPVSLESIGVLAMYGLLNKVNIAGGIDPQQNELIKFCQGIAADERSLNDFTYLDEIRTLQLGSNKKDILNILESRFSLYEDSTLDALDIGEFYDYQ